MSEHGLRLDSVAYPIRVRTGPGRLTKWPAVAGGPLFCDDWKFRHICETTELILSAIHRKLGVC
jgi:hypothetical protein